MQEDEKDGSAGSKRVKVGDSSEVCRWFKRWEQAAGGFVQPPEGGSEITCQ